MSGTSITGAVMLLVAYGYQVKRDGEDHVLEDSFELIEDFAEATMPGAFLVDVIPIRMRMLSLP